MMYAKEVLSLIGAFPDREFRMREIVNHVSGGASKTPGERNAMRKAIARVLETMEAGGSIIRTPPLVGPGGYATYKLITYEKRDMHSEESAQSCVTITPPQLRPEKTPDEVREIRRAAKARGLRDPAAAYSGHKSRAANRQVAFNLTFAEWWGFWALNYHLRGNGPEDLCMARHGDVGAYEVGNIYLTTCRNNLADYAASDKKVADQAQLKRRRKDAFQQLIDEANARTDPPKYTFEQVGARLKLGLPVL